MSWIQPDGVVTPLTGQDELDVHWALGVDGRFMPPVQIEEEPLPQQHGARLRNVRYTPREVTLPISIIGADETAVRRKLRELLKAFSPTRGDGLLRNTGPDGSMRELVCRYQAGMQGTESRDSMGRTFQRAVVVLRSLDPFWRDSTDTGTTYTVGTVQTFLTDPFLRSGSMLTNDTILGSQTITNDGDFSAEPVFTVVGPASSFTLTNTLTGEKINYTASLAAGEQITVDTRAGRKSVLRSDGTNLYANLSLDSTLFDLDPGQSGITLSLPGATTASYLTMAYRRRWLGP